MTVVQLNHGRNKTQDNYATESKTEIQSAASSLENKIKEPISKYVERKISPDLKRLTFQQSQDLPCSSRTVDFVSRMDHMCSDVRLETPLEMQDKHPKENHSDMHDHFVLSKDANAQERIPLDLSEKSTRADSCNRSFTSTLQAALIVHPCPYCSHKTYYPEVLWMHKRIWHKVSCNSVAPPWVLQNGFKSIKNHTIFMARSGRTGPPPALGGKECQPLPIARFTRTQVPSGLSGSKTSSSSLGVTGKTGTVPKEVSSTANYGPQSSNVDGYRQPKLNHTHEQHSTVAQQPQFKSKFEVNSKAAQAGCFSRSSTSSHTIISRSSSQPSNSKQAEKYTIPQVNTGFAPISKHCNLDAGKAKFVSPPQYHPPCKTEPYVPQEDLSVPQQEVSTKRENEMRALTNCMAGSRAGPLMPPQLNAAGPPPTVHSIKQEPPSEGHEKRLDVLNIFKTYIPKDLATLYQTWGANSPVVDHAGKNYFDDYS